MSAFPDTPRSSHFFPWDDDLDIPVIDSDEDFFDVVSKLSEYVSKSVDSAYSYEQLRTSIAGQRLRPFVSRLSDECHHPGIVAAILAAAYVFRSTDDDDTGLGESRALACELVAWQFLTFLSEKELIDYLLDEIDAVSDQPREQANQPASPESSQGVLNQSDGVADERSHLLATSAQEEHVQPLRQPKRATFSFRPDVNGDENSSTKDDRRDLANSMKGMNALEIAAVANAKKFMSQRPVQKIVDDIWNGDVIFWTSLSVNSTKKARLHNKRLVTDPWVRLRVPKYQKALQSAFFIAFLGLYFAVLAGRVPTHITFTEVLLYIWIAAFAYDEFGELQDAGLLFYRKDIWSFWDSAIILVGLTFLIIRIVGLVKHDDYVTDVAFDVLSLAALFLVPRICSVASLNPFFGSLLPVLAEMTTTFCKFLPVVIILYLGFLSCFTALARDRLTVGQMSFILVEMFFGSSYKGFEVAVQISPIFGYTLMIIFVALTNIILITVLISLVSNTISSILSRSREEYLFQYSIYVLESSTSRRLTYYHPPFNLLPLLLIRPLRLFFPSETVRRIRIFALKVTHLPVVALLWCYEGSRRLVSPGSHPPQSARTDTLARPFTATSTSIERSRPTRRSAVKPSNRRVLDPSTASGESAVGAVEDIDLLALVKKLSDQVDELTAMVAGQRSN